jgi:glycosyltransferase involved in cell wall biosynthesis
VDSRGFREDFGLSRDTITLVTVSRLAEYQKADSIVRTIAVLRRLGRRLPLKLLILGDGAARSRLEALAAEANADLGRQAVVLTGALLDPRAAYAAADIVIGMGGSALRGMAFGKPVVIVGEGGFAEVFSPRTAPNFYHTGMFGRGDGDPENRNLSDALLHLAEDATARSALGQFGRNFVTSHHSLDLITDRLARFCRQAQTETPRLPVTAGDAMRTALVYLRERRFLTASRDPFPSDRT